MKNTAIIISVLLFSVTAWLIFRKEKNINSDSDTDEHNEKTYSLQEIIDSLF